MKLSATITAFLGSLSVPALVMLFLALSDIANHEPNLTLEWYITGICIIILSAFTISTLITLRLLFKSFEK